MPDSNNSPLVLWAGCVWQRPLLERTEAVHAGRFSCMSLFTGDVSTYVEQHGSLRSLRHELDARETSINCIDPYLAWYPGYNPAAASGDAALHLRASEDDVLRYVEALGASYVSIVGPFGGPDAPFDAVVESLGNFADRAATIGARPHLEIVPSTKIPTLAAAIALLRAVNRPNLGLLLDTYNLERAGDDPSELSNVPLEQIFAIQLADGHATPVGGDYFADGLHHRQAPGKGDLRVADWVNRISAKGPLPPIGPEIFQDELNAMESKVAGEYCAHVSRDFLAKLQKSNSENND